MNEANIADSLCRGRESACLPVVKLWYNDFITDVLHGEIIILLQEHIIMVDFRKEIYHEKNFSFLPGFAGER
jgi:hypothetical protein